VVGRKAAYGDVDTPMVDSATTNVVLRPWVAEMAEESGADWSRRNAIPNVASEASGRRPDLVAEKTSWENQDRRVARRCRNQRTRWSSVRLANSTCRGVLTGVPALACSCSSYLRNLSSP